MAVPIVLGPLTRLPTGSAMPARPLADRRRPDRSWANPGYLLPTRMPRHRCRLRRHRSRQRPPAGKAPSHSPTQPRRSCSPCRTPGPMPYLRYSSSPTGRLLPRPGRSNRYTQWINGHPGRRIRRRLRQPRIPVTRALRRARRRPDSGPRYRLIVNQPNRPPVRPASDRCRLPTSRSPRRLRRRPPSQHPRPAGHGRHPRRPGPPSRATIVRRR